MLTSDFGKSFLSTSLKTGWYSWCPLINCRKPSTSIFKVFLVTTPSEHISLNARSIFLYSGSSSISCLSFSVWGICVYFHFKNSKESLKFWIIWGSSFWRADTSTLHKTLSISLRTCWVGSSCGSFEIVWEIFPKKWIP